MYVATLISATFSRSLELTLLNNLRNAWGGGEIVWLSPTEAAEFDIPDRPKNISAIHNSLHQMGVDLVVQPKSGRKKKLLLADMDSTMIEQECIDELADQVGVGMQVADITAQAMNGEIGFKDSLERRVRLLAGHDSSVIDTVLNTRITLASGGRELLATMKFHGGYSALVSGGFTDFAKNIAQSLSFDEYRANTLLHKDGRFTGKVLEPILGRDAKVEALQDIANQQGIDVSQVMAVGDGANDLGMLSLAGAGVALHAKPAVAAQCDIQINHGDLTALLFIQGYHRDEILT